MYMKEAQYLRPTLIWLLFPPYWNYFIRIRLTHAYNSEIRRQNSTFAQAHKNSMFTRVFRKIYLIDVVKNIQH